MAPGTDAHALTAGPAEGQHDDAAAEWAAALIHGRRTVLPKRLAPPGPDASQLDMILSAASAAPDHGELVPWRFVLVPAGARHSLAEAFATSLRERDAQATDEQLQQAREKAYRAPVLMLAIVRIEDEHDGVPASERILSAGCAIQNMLLMATALGFGSALTSGKALQSPSLRALFSLSPQEQALCFLSLGTVATRKPGRSRPSTMAYVSELKVPP